MNPWSTSRTGVALGLVRGTGKRRAKSSTMPTRSK